ncbi:MAG: hypothetical protein ACP5D1_03665 [Bacteroidales bacterium]
MKNTFLFASCLLGCILTTSVPAQQATIKIDILRQVGEIDRNIYGVFMEPIRNSMDGLLYNPEHPLANEQGFRSDYIEAARELQLTNMRWPGGITLPLITGRTGSVLKKTVRCAGNWPGMYLTETM